MRGIRMLAPEGIPPIHAGDDLPQILTAALHTVGEIQNGDILVLAHKIISKAEGRVYSLSQVTPSPEALRYAQMTGKDPRILQVVLEESSEVVKVRPGVIITRHKLGFICANAAVDHSNAGGEDLVVALPRDPDQSATTQQAIARRLEELINRRWRERDIGEQIRIAQVWQTVRDTPNVRLVRGILLEGRFDRAGVPRVVPLEEDGAFPYATVRSGLHLVQVE